MILYVSGAVGVDLIGSHRQCLVSPRGYAVHSHSAPSPWVDGQKPNISVLLEQPVKGIPQMGEGIKDDSSLITGFNEADGAGQNASPDSPIIIGGANDDRVLVPKEFCGHVGDLRTNS
jgi:hypothetical protein